MTDDRVVSFAVDEVRLKITRAEARSVLERIVELRAAASPHHRGAVVVLDAHRRGRPDLENGHR